MAVDFQKTVLAASHRAFGERILYTPKGGTTFELCSGGVYTDRHEEVELGTDIAASSVNPTLDVILADFPAGAPPKRGDTYLRDKTGETFEVRDPQSDGHGGAKLISKRT